MNLVVTLLTAVLLTAPTTSWSINGHLFVANIAQNVLQETIEDTFETALTMLD